MEEIQLALAKRALYHHHPSPNKAESGSATGVVSSITGRGSGLEIHPRPPPRLRLTVARHLGCLCRGHDPAHSAARYECRARRHCPPGLLSRYELHAGVDGGTAAGGVDGGTAAGGVHAAYRGERSIYVAKIVMSHR
ncbi:uncharacterized protein PG986_012027 [Apiospora aurea]|uniref:Uncharacterized protein n=1 Tax=Apiospora aurea TaxID=335848 RepID=A0ABR1PYT9_9PEZI